MGRNIAILSFLFLFCNQIIAQPGKVRERWEESLEKADALMQQHSYYNAADKYKAALNLKKNDADIIYKLAEAYRLARNYKNAASQYARLRKMLQKAGTEHTDALLALKHGQMLKQAGDYDEAEEVLTVFAGSQKSNSPLKFQAENEIAGIKLARKSAKPSIKVRDIAVLGKNVNSRYTEFAPTPYGKNELLFSSLKANQLIETDVTKTYSKIYTISLDENAPNAKASEFDGQINTDAQHVGHGTFSNDGKRFYFTICDFEVTDNRVKCQIYMAEKNGTSWAKTKKLDANVNQEGYESTTPFVTSNESGDDVLYFSSNRPGTRGGLDLWAVTRSLDGNISTPINLGEKINTASDETTPYLDNAEGYSDNRPILYFSSNGHPSFGGFDVFKAYKNNVNFSDWTNPENGGASINTSADELYFGLTPSKDRAFFVSNRDGSASIYGKNCCDDIYAGFVGEPIAPVTIVADIVGKVLDEKEKMVAGASLTLFELAKNGTRQSIKTFTQASKGYIFEGLGLEKDYLVVVQKQGFPTQEHKFSTKGLKQNKRFEKDFYLKKETTTPKPEDVELYIEGQVFSDKGPQGKSVLNGASVEIIRINAKTGQETSFKTLTSEGEGNFKTKLPAGYIYKLIGSEPSHLRATTTIDCTNVTGKETRKADLVLTINQTNVAFKIDNIYYDFDSANLRDESIPNLQVLLKLLQDNPNVKIEIGSHTDNKGTEQYNQQLSQKRAQSVVNWLIGEGIVLERLVAKGYGETQPVAPNANADGSDNPDGRQLNRRTEFKLIK